MNTMNALKAPPHSMEAEQAVLACVFASPATAHDLTLEADQFYRMEHRLIWSSVKALIQRNQTADILSVSEYMRDTGSLREAGGIEYLADIASCAFAISSVSSYAAIVRERAAERRMISIGHRVADMGYHGEGRTLAERAAEAQGWLSELEDPASAEGPKQLDGFLSSAMTQMDTQQRSAGKLIGVSTGYVKLDERTQGLCPDQLIIIAGRPGMGKSSLLLNIAENVALAGGLVVLFSLEMPGIEIGYRVLASQARVPADRLRTAGMVHDEWDRLALAADKMRGKPLFIDERAGVSSTQIIAVVREVERRTGQKVALVGADYLQLFSDRGDGQGRVSQISRNLKLAAKSLHCPVIALSQLNRSVEQRGDKRPMMSDLRESGAIEADADSIWMVYRDEVYNPGSRFKGVAEVITRKARSGKPGTDMLADNLNYYRFDNLAADYQPPLDDM